jgi:hypothetical protein
MAHQCGDLLPGMAELREGREFVPRGIERVVRTPSGPYGATQLVEKVGETLDELVERAPASWDTD